MNEKELVSKLKEYKMDGCGVMSRYVKDNECVIKLHYYFVRGVKDYPDQAYIQSVITEITGGSIIRDKYVKHVATDESHLFDYEACVKMN